MLYLIAVCGLEEGLPQAWIGKHTNATLQNTICILAAKNTTYYLVVNQPLQTSTPSLAQRTHNHVNGLITTASVAKPRNTKWSAIFPSN
jgi:hypothetical protein